MEKNKIMVINHRRDVVRQVAKRLKDGNCEVIGAYDEKSAIEFARTKKPHLILLDIMLPMLNGFEVLQQLKKDPRTKNIPLVVMSTKSTTEEMVNTVRTYSDRYLIKPVSTDKLLESINSTLMARRADAVKLDHYVETDRRSELRKPGKFGVKYALWTDVMAGKEPSMKAAFCSNIATGGICIMTKQPLQPQTKVALAVSLPDVQDTFLTNARVIWTKRAAWGRGKRWESGLIFLKLSHRDRQSISNTLNK